MSTPQNFKDLQHLTGYTKIPDVVACLSAQGITFYRGHRGKPFTTTGLIEQAGFKPNQPITNQNPEKQRIELE